MNLVMLHGRYYTCPPKDMGKYEQQWLLNLYAEISTTSNYLKNHLINCTWLDLSKEKQDFIDYIYSDDPSSCKVWLAGSVDGLKGIVTNKFYFDLQSKGYTISTVGFSAEHWNSWFPYWLHEFSNNADTTLNPNIKYLYMSYNRKPHLHRKHLVQKLIQNNLLDLGHVTFQSGIFPEVDVSTAHTEQNFYNEMLQLYPHNYSKDQDDIDLRYSRPEDPSLGNLDIWNNTYLNIISETTTDDPYMITEKTWKPILGLRPFIVNGHCDIYYVLHKLGFYTTMHFFDDFTLNDGSIESIIRLLNKLKGLSKEELYQLYCKQLPLLEANKKRFKEICSLDKTKILNWYQAV